MDADEKDKVDWSQVLERNIESCRWNSTKTKFIVKAYRVPKFCMKKIAYKHEDILKKIYEEDW